MEQLYLGTIGLSAIATDPRQAAEKCFQYMAANPQEVTLTVYDSKTQNKRKFRLTATGEIYEYFPPKQGGSDGNVGPGV